MITTPAQARRAYAQTTAQTQSPTALVVLVYERLVADIRTAQAALGRRDVDASHKALVHAQDLVVELRYGLDLRAWEGAEQLDRIYEYLHGRLVEANVHKDASPLGECLSIADTLGEAWRGAVAQLTS